MHGNDVNYKCQYICFAKALSLFISRILNNVSYKAYFVHIYCSRARMPLHLHLFTNPDR